MASSLLRLGVMLIAAYTTHGEFTESTTHTFTGTCYNGACGEEEGRGICIQVQPRTTLPTFVCQCIFPYGGVGCDSLIDTRSGFILPTEHEDEGHPLHMEYSACEWPEYCWATWRDGFCHKECNNAECLFDGGDCTEVHETLPGALAIQLGVPPSEFFRLQRLFLEDLDFHLRATVRISQDATGPLVWEFDEATKRRGKRVTATDQGNSSLPLTEVEVSVDIVECPKECFAAVEKVVEYLNKFSKESKFSKEAKVDTYSGNATHSALTSFLRSARAIVPRRRPSITPPKWLPTWTHSIEWKSLIGAFVLLMCIVVVIAVAIFRGRVNRKRTIEAPTWKVPFLGSPASPAVRSDSSRAHCSSSVHPTHIPFRSSLDATPFPHSAWVSTSGVPMGGTSLLHQHASGTGDLWFEQGTDVNGRDSDGRSPLLLVMMSERNTEEAQSMTAFLLNYGADINTRDYAGVTTLHAAVRRAREPSFLRWLLDMGADGTALDSESRSVLHAAAAACLPDALRELLTRKEIRQMVDHADARNETALMVAVGWSRSAPALRCTRALLDGGADGDLAGYEVADPTLNTRPPLHHAVINKHWDQAALLITKGVNIDGVDGFGRSSLHVAALYGDEEGVRLLIGNGAAIKLLDDNDQTAEQLARERGHIHVADYLATASRKPGANLKPPPEPRKRIRHAPNSKAKQRRLSIVDFFQSVEYKDDSYPPSTIGGMEKEEEIEDQHSLSSALDEWMITRRVAPPPPNRSVTSLHSTSSGDSYTLPFTSPFQGSDPAPSSISNDSTASSSDRDTDISDCVPPERVARDYSTPYWSHAQLPFIQRESLSRSVNSFMTASSCSRPVSGFHPTSLTTLVEDSASSSFAGGRGRPVSHPDYLVAPPKRRERTLQVLSRSSAVLGPDSLPQSTLQDDISLPPAHSTRPFLTPPSESSSEPSVPEGYVLTYLDM